MSQDWRTSEKGPKPVPAPGPDGYDACTPGMLPADLIGIFTDLQEDFLRGLARGLSEYLETPVSAVLSATEQASCAAYLADGQDVCRVILDVDDNRGQAYLGLSPGLVSRTLGVLLAIPADSPVPPRDSVTEIELHVMHRFFHILTGELKRAWEPSHVAFTARPLFGGGSERPAESTEDTLLVMTCTVKFAEGEDTLRLAVPALMVRLVALQREQEEALTPAVTPHPGVLDALRHAAVDVEAVLAGSAVRMRDLLAMEPGQILMLGQNVAAPVECRINGRIKFRGELIQTGARRAMQVDTLAAPRANGK